MVHDQVRGRQPRAHVVGVDGRDPGVEVGELGGEALHPPIIKGTHPFIGMRMRRLRAGSARMVPDTLFDRSRP